MKTFFALTFSGSLYRVDVPNVEEGKPSTSASVTKIDQRQSSSKVPIGTSLQDGKSVFISQKGISLFTGDPPDRMFGGRTSPLLGMFLSEERARSAFSVFDFSEVKVYGPETQEVLDEIAREPAFEVVLPVLYSPEPKQS